jgi:hypothetical protein
MRTVICVVSLWAALNPQQEIGWLKFDQAKSIAAHTGKLIAVYVACDPRSGSAPCSGGIAERAFDHPSILKRQDEFHFVRVCEKKTAQVVRATKPPEAIFTDADGDEVYRSGFIDAGSLDQAMAAALLRYAPHEVAWRGEIAASSGGRPLLIVGFDDDKAETLKVFEDKTLVKYQDRIEFVRLPFKKDGEAARKWGVTQTPAIFLCDAAKENPERNAIEKLAGKKNPAVLKAAIQKALLRTEKLDPKK